MSNEVRDAVETLVEALKKDPAYYYGWQANIAVQFIDECERQHINSHKMHDAANNAAKNFLNLLIGLKNGREN